MPVTLDEVRQRLHWSSSPQLLGRLLHELYAALTGRDPRVNLSAPLELADASVTAWHQALTDHAFAAVVSPALARHEDELQTHGAALLEFWKAARELCGWLAGLMHAERVADTTRSLEALRNDLFAATSGAQTPLVGHAFGSSDALVPPPGGNRPVQPSRVARQAQPTGIIDAPVLPSRTARQAQTAGTLNASSNAPGGSTRFLIGMAAGQRHSADLSDTQCPHVLVVGPAGAGKTEWLRTALASLLTANTPATLRLALIDPRGAFGALQGSPFLWSPSLQTAGAAPLLHGLVRELERRHARLESAPRILCIIDDYADLPARGKASRAALDAPLAQIAAAGRTAGMHLIVASRRFARELHGAIGQLPARLAFALPRKSDSRRVLGVAGAETLGRGELLYKDLGAPLKLQEMVTSAAELAAAAARV
jgi:hypothetical protein